MTGKSIKQETIHIAVIEDDPLRLVGLRSIFDHLSGFQLTPMSVSQIATGESIDLVLIGNYSGFKFVETMANLKTLRPELPVIVTGASSNDEAILKALGCGAKGYVDEAAPVDHLVQAIHAVHAGLVWAPRRVISSFIESAGHLFRRNYQLGNSNLTARETQVLQMLVEGRSNKEIGSPLGIEERTVKAHIAKMMRKVGVHNRIELSVYAVNRSLVAAH